ncbi:hypothetical protein EDD15DRAFT_2507147 [Pisolithus albus]|nr:hypothetical protein EDD15DRAFT_2507147 [Pisolithus albus]
MLDQLLELTQTARDRIFDHFHSLPQDERAFTNHFDIDPEGKPTLFVKYGCDKDELAPGIPKVYDAFCEKRMVFLRHGKIELPTLSTCEISEDDTVQSVAPIVKWLLARAPSVPPSIFGRISSEEACVWHSFFKGFKGHWAPLPFVNADALTKYVNKAFSYAPGKSKRSISFSDDLAIYHSDIRKDNFLHDTKSKKTWIVDFQHIDVFPEPFQVYAFFNTGNRFAAAVGACLGLQRSNAANEMTWASGLLRQIGGDGSLDLDRFGECISTYEGRC